MRISARNKLKGKVVEVTKGQTTAHVRIDVNGTISRPPSQTKRWTTLG